MAKDKSYCRLHKKDVARRQREYIKNSNINTVNGRIQESILDDPNDESNQVEIALSDEKNKEKHLNQIFNKMFKKSK